MQMFIRLSKGISHHNPQVSKRTRKDRLVFYLTWLSGGWKLSKLRKQNTMWGKFINPKDSIKYTLFAWNCNGSMLVEVVENPRYLAHFELSNGQIVPDRLLVAPTASDFKVLKEKYNKTGEPMARETVEAFVAASSANTPLSRPMNWYYSDPQETEAVKAVKNAFNL